MTLPRPRHMPHASAGAVPRGWPGRLRAAMAVSGSVPGAVSVTLAVSGAVSVAVAGCAGVTGEGPVPVPGGGNAFAGLPRYIAPAPGQPSARLLLRGAMQPGDRFAALRYDDAEHCAAPRVTAEGSWQAAAPAVSVAAGAPTTLVFVIARAGAGNPLTHCATLSFTPQAGRSYLLQGGLAGSGCTVQLLDATQPDRPQPPPDVVPRSIGSERCVPMARARDAARSRSTGSASMLGGQVDGEAVLNPRATAADLIGLIRP